LEVVFVRTCSPREAGWLATRQWLITTQQILGGTSWSLNPAAGVLILLEWDLRKEKHGWLHRSMTALVYVDAFILCIK
jgi:hypothetical protein